MHAAGEERRLCRIAVSGASGFIGKALCDSLRGQGYEVVTLTRTKPSGASEAIFWNPTLDYIDTQSLENFDVVINLSGTPTSGRRWSSQRKTEFKETRVKCTKLLASTISRLKKPPSLFLSASGIGYYGDRGTEILTEESKPGSGFFSQVCREWELATWQAQAIGRRVHHLRFGIVLAKEGGALKEMLPPFRLGLGAVFGSGEQYFPWVTMSDAVRAIQFLINNPLPTGPINIVAPDQATNKELTKALAKSLNRSAFLKMPEALVRIIAGEVGATLLLSSARVIPEKLTQAGFAFEDRSLQTALTNILRK